MIEVATGDYRIQEKEKEYTELYQDVKFEVDFLEGEGIPISNPNNFTSLWDWYRYWSSNLEGYSSRRQYIHGLYSSVINQIENTLHSRCKQPASSAEGISTLEIRQVENFSNQIRQLQSIMIDVATGNSSIQDEEETYISLFQEILYTFRCLKNEGMLVENPNSFRSLWQWHDYWKNNIENTYSARREYINCLYESVVKPIKEALYRQRLKQSSVLEFYQDLKQKFSPQTPIQTSSIKYNGDLQVSAKTSEVPHKQAASVFLSDEALTSHTETIDNSFSYKNFDGNWIEKNAMNPEIFLVKEDVMGLEKSLETVLSNNFRDSTSVKDIFILSDIDDLFTRSINFNLAPSDLTRLILAKLKKYKISAQRLDYHPLINLLEYFLKRQDIYQLEDQDIYLFNKLVERGQENFKVLKARRGVGRIESPKGTGIATGVIIGRNLLLTCNHVFSKTQVKQAWVRFNCKVDNHQSEQYLFELDMNFICNHSNPDYALVKIKGSFSEEIVISASEILDSEQDIHLIHHPQGKPLVISSLGQIKQVGDNYIQHNVSTDNGSSGAPIFNRQWELIAIHRGNHGIGGRNVEPGTVEGIPLRAFWDKISPHLN